MKKILFSAIMLCVLIMIVFLSGAIIIKRQKNKISAENISRFPAFTASTITGQIYSSDEIKSGPVLIIHFHPECEHCQYELSEIFRHTDSLNGIKILMISAADAEVTKSFVNQYGYNSTPDVQILIDTNDDFGKIFKTGIIPSHHLYNKKLELVNVLKGEYKFETILRYILEEKSKR